MGGLTTNEIAAFVTVALLLIPDWLKMKNADGPAVKREAEEDWDEMTRRVHRKSEAVRF